MKRCICQQLYCAFSSDGFWLSLAIGGCISLSHYFFYVWLPYADPRAVAETLTAGYYLSVFNQWLGASMHTVQGYLFFLLLPVLAVLPFACSFAQERKSGMLEEILLASGGRVRYLLAKFLAVFLSAGTAVLLPLGLNLALTAATVPALTPMTATGSFFVFSTSMWAELFYTWPWFYTLGYLAIIFVYAGLLAQICLWLSYFVRNQLLLLFAPCLLCLATYALCSALRFHAFSPLHFLPPQQTVYFISFPVIAGEAALLLVINAVLFFYKGRNEDVLL